jgi:uncharacterized protein YpuA (DUF1002 family)
MYKNQGINLIKDEIQQRIETINNEMAQVRSSYAKLEGHLAEAQHWLSQLELKKENEIILDDIN